MRTPLESLLESLSGDGTADTIGTVDDIGHHALLLDVSRDELQRAAADIRLAPDERQEALDEHGDHAGPDGTAHYILRTDYQGFLYYEGFATAEEARAAWSTVEALDQAHHDEQQAELARTWEAQYPARWIIRQHAATGCSAPDDVFEDEASARAELDSRLASLRARGFDVSTLDVPPPPADNGAPYVKMLARFEATGPDEQLMIGDDEGTFTLLGPNDDARACACDSWIERNTY